MNSNIYLEELRFEEMQEVATVNKIQSSSVCPIPVQVGNENIETIIDTAAESTILSDKIFNNVAPRPKTLS